MYFIVGIIVGIISFVLIIYHKLIQDFCKNDEKEYFLITAIASIVFLGAVLFWPIYILSAIVILLVYLLSKKIKFLDNLLHKENLK